MERLFVDRIENEIAVCEKNNRDRMEIPLKNLPEDVREGSVLILKNNGNFELDYETEAARRKELFELQNSLFDD